MMSMMPVSIMDAGSGRLGEVIAVVSPLYLSVYLSMCVCVCERERERVCGVCVRERERVREIA